MLEEMQQQVRRRVEEALPRFLEARQQYFTSKELETLREVIRTKQPLHVFRNQVHEALVRNLSSGEFDSTPFWAMEDAISFLVDVETKRWPYATEATMKRDLQWALEEVDTALMYGLPAQSSMATQTVMASTAFNMVGPYLKTDAKCPFCQHSNTFLFIESPASPVKALDVCRHVRARLIDEDGNNKFEFQSDH